MLVFRFHLSVFRATGAENINVLSSLPVQYGVVARIVFIIQQDLPARWVASTR